ncbi:putative nuclear RNA export factor SDE5 [Citrus sinensis]|uniref:Nuclear RNA export factor SDE5 n=1 Tax=Citrus sinensis TaxID=2711 RepID=A0ACB8NX61_CITSI|nr:putative nuclear RNA export factor SDE5 [Citrus sinensis]
MKKQAIASTILCDAEVRELEELLGAFGSQFSLEDIASAYCEAKRDVNGAANILCSMNGIGCAIDASRVKFKGEDKTTLEVASDSVLPKSHHEERNTGVSTSKSRPVSMGTVSGVIGKEYIRTKSLPNNSCEPTKPVKLDSKEFPVSKIWCEKGPPNMTTKHDSMLADVEEFLFKMLGDGFQLDMTMIEEVLGCCGFDMQKSMEKLIELSALTLEKYDDVVNLADVKIYTSAKIIHVVRPERRPKGFGKPVTEPYEDTITGPIAAERKMDARDDDEDDENSYEVLRKAVKEYWILMREYYKAGHFFRQKASEADRKSAEKLVKTRNNEVMTLDWHLIEPKEVVCLLRVHLTSLSGIPTIKHLRIVVGTSDEDSKKEARKRMIKKLLKKESIEWTEDGNGQAILIQVDVIDPKRLSFFRKK